MSDGDEVVTSPFSFVASANAILYERATPVFADIDPVTLNLDPDAAAAAITGRTTALLPVHIFGYPADVPALEAPRPADRRGRLRGARRACTPTARRSAAAGTRRSFGFYANKQLTTGEGGMLTMGSAEHKERVDSERNQGRAPDMGWLDHDRLGFNYRLTDVACAIGLAQLERLDEHAGRAGAGGRLVPRGAGRRRPARAAVRGPRRRRARLVRVRRPAPARASTATTTIRALLERGVQSKPYLPAIHLMSFYRERFGHREGEFPVCEDVAARSVALPFFPEMTEGEVAQVAEALGAVIRA